jgi:hypothetical protein
MIRRIRNDRGKDVRHKGIMFPAGEVVALPAPELFAQTEAQWLCRHDFIDVDEEAAAAAYASAVEPVIDNDDAADDGLDGSADLDDDLNGE